MTAQLKDAVPDYNKYPCYGTPHEEQTPLRVSFTLEELIECALRWAKATCRGEPCYHEHLGMLVDFVSDLMVVEDGQ